MHRPMEVEVQRDCHTEADLCSTETLPLSPHPQPPPPECPGEQLTAILYSLFENRESEIKSQCPLTQVLPLRDHSLELGQSFCNGGR